MIAKLLMEADNEATELTYCDRWLAKSMAEQNELEEIIATVTSNVDRAAARSARLRARSKCSRRCWPPSHRAGPDGFVSMVLKFGGACAGPFR